MTQAAFTAQLAALQKLIAQIPDWYLHSIVNDDVDPDDVSLFYRADGRQRVVGSLGQVRILARIATIVTQLADLLLEDEGPLLPVSLVTEIANRVRRDTLADAKAAIAQSIAITGAEHVVGLRRATEIIQTLMLTQPGLEQESTMIDDATIAQWRALSAQAQQMAQKAAADPSYRDGLALVLSGPSDAKTLLRACAEKVIPPAFKWDIVMTIGGNYFLTLLTVAEEPVEKATDLARAGLASDVPTDTPPRTP